MRERLIFFNLNYETLDSTIRWYVLKQGIDFSLSYFSWYTEIENVKHISIVFDILAKAVPMFKNYGGIENIDLFNEALPDGKRSSIVFFLDKTSSFDTCVS